MHTGDKVMGRRDFLRLSAVLSGALVLGGCAPTPQSSPAPAGQAAPTAAPAAAGQAAPTAALAPQIQATRLRLMSGPMGGTWYPLGGAIAEILAKEIPGVTMDVQPGGGIANVKGIEEGKIEIGFSNACSAADAINGLPPFEAKAQNVVSLMAIHDQIFQMMASEDSGITSVADFKGKQLVTQATGNTGEALTRLVLKAYGYAYEDMAKVHLVSFTDGADLMKDRHADVMALITGIPNANFVDLSLTRKMRLISVPDEKIKELQTMNPGLGPRIVPKGTYTNQDEDIKTFGTYAHLAISAKLPDDLVYAMTKAIAKNVEMLGEVAAPVKGLDVKGMAADVGVPLHPAAARFYKEAGVL